MSTKDLILNPDKFFRDLSNKEPSLIPPFLIILTLSVLNAIHAYYTTSVMMNLFPPEMQSNMSIILIVSMLSAFLGGFIGWLLIAGIMHLISIVFKGEGSFKRTLEFIGYGFFPNIVGVLITMLVSYYFLSNIQIPTLTMEQLQNPEVAEKILSSIIPDTMTYTTTLIDIAVTLWNLGLWTYGIKYARNLDLKKAFIVALVPTALFLISKLLSIITALR